MAGSQAAKKPVDSMSGLELKKKTDDVSPHKYTEGEKKKVKKEPEILNPDLEITINNCGSIK